MFRLLLIVAIIATIPFLIYSGMRRRLLSAISATATVYLVLIGISYLARIPFFTQQLQDTIGAIVIVTFVAVAGYTVLGISATRGDTIIRTDSTTFSPPRTGTVTTSFSSVDWTVAMALPA